MSLFRQYRRYMLLHSTVCTECFSFWPTAACTKLRICGSVPWQYKDGKLHHALRVVRDTLLVSLTEDFMSAVMIGHAGQCTVSIL